MRIWSSGSLALSRNCLFWLILLSFLSPSIPASSSSVIVVVVMLLWHHCLPRARTMTTIRHEWTPPRFPRKGKKDTKWCYYRHSYYREYYLVSVFYPRTLQNINKFVKFKSCRKLILGLLQRLLKKSELHSHWRSPSDNLMNWLIRLGSIR